MQSLDFLALRPERATPILLRAAGIPARGGPWKRPSPCSSPRPRISGKVPPGGSNLGTALNRPPPNAHGTLSPRSAPLAGRALIPRRARPLLSTPAEECIAGPPGPRDPIVFPFPLSDRVLTVHLLRKSPSPFLSPSGGEGRGEGRHPGSPRGGFSASSRKPTRRQIGDSAIPTGNRRARTWENA